MASLAKMLFLTILKSMKRLMFLVLLLLTLIGRIWGQEEDNEMAFTLTSSAFAQGGTIARSYSCDGRDISPPLSWENAPDGSESFVLICDDPDAPVGTWVHWVLYNISGGSRNLPEGLSSAPELNDGSRQGKNDFNRIGYGGPCPPRGSVHRYFFKLYALDTMLNLSAGLRKEDILKAIDGHLLGQAQLAAKYSRS